MANEDTLCGWGEAGRVKYYLDTVAISVPKRDEQLAFILELFPWPTETPLRVLDLGAGFGAIAKEILTRYPRSSVTCLDGSGEMMKIARERLAQFGERVSFHLGDLAYPTWRDRLSGTYDATVSALAIHHITDERKRALYAEVFGLLKPGGVFLNDDSILTPQPWQARFESLRYRYIQEQERALRGTTRSIKEIMAERKARSGHRQSYKAPLRNQLEWLIEAGFEAVDCFWKYLDHAIFGGIKVG